MPEMERLPLTEREVGVQVGSGMSPAEALVRARTLGTGGFAAIDFETATRYRSSACAVGVALVDAGEVQAVQRWLIQPPNNEYEGINISIHGITPTMTEDAPTIEDVWPDVLEQIGNRPIVAHFASFDLSVVRASLCFKERQWSDLQYVCTRALAKATWPGWLSYRLPDVANACGIDFNHHDPADDAAAAATVALACAGAVEAGNLPDAARRLHVGIGRLSATTWWPSGQIDHRGRISDLEPTVAGIDRSSPFFGTTVVFTGAMTMVHADAAQLVVNAGGHCATTMSKRVNFLVLGEQDPRKVVDGVHSSKMLRAKEFLADGADIEVISEIDFFRMLDNE